MDCERSRLDNFLHRHYRAVTCVVAASVLACVAIFFFLTVDYDGEARYALLSLAALAPLELVGCFVLLKRRVSFEKVTIVLILVFGMMYMAIMGPMKIPDEQSHYYAAYRYSNVLLGMDGLSYSVPMRADDAELMTEWHDDRKDYSADYSDIMQSSWTLENDDLVSFEQDFGYGFDPLSRPPQLHIAAAIGITLGRLLSLGAMPTFYLGRITALLFAAFALYVALRILPFGRRSFAAFLLLPSTLMLLASYSYDGPIICLAALLGSVLLRSIYDTEPFGKKEWALIAVLVFLIVPAKLVYTAIAVLVLFIPATRFASRRQRALFVASIVLLAAGTFLLFKLPSVLNIASSPAPDAIVSNSSGKTGSEGFEPSYTFSMAISDPAHAIALFIDTVLLNSSRHVQGFFGGVLGWSNFTGPWYVVIIFVVLVLFAVSTDRIKPIRPSLRLSSGIAFALAVSAIYCSMMFGWITVKDEVIVGIQGRYFLPLFPLLFVIAAGLLPRLRKSFDSITLCAYSYFNLFYIIWMVYSILSW